MGEERIGMAAENGDLDFAERHARANKIGYDDPDQKKFLCPCCLMNCNKKDFQFLCSVEDLSEVGVGYTLYFKLIMNLKYLMIVLSIFHSAISFWLNVQGNFCQNYNPLDALNNNFCESNIWNISSLANRVNEERTKGRQVYIDAVFFYILLVSLFVIRLNLYYEVIKTKDRRGHAINDFTVYCLKLPKMGTARLKVLMERYFSNLNLNSGISYEIENISFCMDNREHNNLLQRKKDLQRKIKKAVSSYNLKERKISEEKVAKLEQEHKEVLDRIQKITEEFDKSEYTYTPLFTRKAFITFKIYGAACDLLQRYSEEFYTTILWRKVWNYLRGENGEGKNNLMFEGVSLKLVPAVYPSNFIWENASVSNFEKAIRRGIILLLEFVLFCLCFYAVTNIARFQIFLRRDMLQESYESTESVRSKAFITMQLIAIGTTFAIISINKFTAEILRRLVFFEKHEKKTAMDTSIAEKLALQYFINSSLTLFLVHSYFENVWKWGGLVYLAAFFMLTNWLAKISASYFDVFYIWKGIQRWYYLKNRPKVPQSQLNQVFEYNEFDFAANIGSILASCYHCFFYSSMVPLVGVANIITQTCEYYLHKWIIINRCSSKKRFGTDLLIQILNYVDLGLIFYSMGTLSTYYVFIGMPPTIYFVNLGISIVYCCLPLNHITRKIIKVPERQFLKRYKDYRTKFENDNYNLYNPVNLRTYVEMSEIST
jgi:Skp family chaperone for outer membrane proteins